MHGGSLPHRAHGHGRWLWRHMHMYLGRWTWLQMDRAAYGHRSRRKPVPWRRPSLIGQAHLILVFAVGLVGGLQSAEGGRMGGRSM